jgi:hypothetical protein
MTHARSGLATALSDRYRFERIEEADIVPLFADPDPWRVP